MDDSSESLAGLTVYPVHNNGRSQVADSISHAIDVAAQALEARGAKIAELKEPRLKKILGDLGRNVGGCARSKLRRSSW